MRAEIVYLRPLCSLKALITGVEAGIQTKVNMENIFDEAGAFNGALSRTGTTDTKEKDRKITLSISGLREISHRMVDYAMDHYDQLGLSPSAPTANKAEVEEPTPCTKTARDWVRELIPYVENRPYRLRVRGAWWVVWHVLHQLDLLKEEEDLSYWLLLLREELHEYDKQFYVHDDRRREEKVCGRKGMKPSQVFKNMPKKEFDGVPFWKWREVAGEDDHLLNYALFSGRICHFVTH